MAEWEARSPVERADFLCRKSVDCSKNAELTAIYASQALLYNAFSPNALQQPALHIAPVSQRHFGHIGLPHV